MKCLQYIESKILSPITDFFHGINKDNIEQPGFSLNEELEPSHSIKENLWHVFLYRAFTLHVQQQPRLIIKTMMNYVPRKQFSAH